MKFKPQLMPNELPTYEDIKYPTSASYKLDGIRCIFKDGEMLSRSLKQIQNKQIQERFQFLKNYSKDNNIILDGEIYSHLLTFQEISSFVMSQDFESEKSIKKYGGVRTLPNHLCFHCFDILDPNNLKEKYIYRIKKLLNIDNKYFNRVEIFGIENKEQLENLFETALNSNYEGLIIRKLSSRYKFGRFTFKSGEGYKFKPYETFDAKIKIVTQATKVDPDSSKTINELGRSVTSKKKEDRILIPKAAAFIVDYEGKEVKVVIAMTDIEKMIIWKNKEKYIGKWLEYKGMLVGAKNVPRHPVMVRFREDKK